MPCQEKEGEIRNLAFLFITLSPLQILRPQPGIKKGQLKACYMLRELLLRTLYLWGGTIVLLDSSHIYIDNNLMLSRGDI
jgi:hypothetical protein